MITLMDIEARRLRYQELLREAEMDRLAQQARQGRHGETLSPRRTLNWLGRQLVVWGTHLQVRSGARMKGPRPLTTNPTT